MRILASKAQQVAKRQTSYFSVVSCFAPEHDPCADFLLIEALPWFNILHLMQTVRSRKSSRDLSSGDVTASRKRAKTEDTSDMENGDVYTNGNGAAHDGSASPPEFLGSRGMVNRKEYIRLLEQALYSLGFRNAAKDLEVASGVDCEPAEVRAFRHAVTEGSWDRAVKLLTDLDFPGELAQKKAKFLVLSEKYLEVQLRAKSSAPYVCNWTSITKPEVRSIPNLLFSAGSCQGQHNQGCQMSTHGACAIAG